MNILVVDDDLISRKVLAAQLRKLGYDVTEAKDGAEAWALLGQVNFSLVITDWMMPVMDGPELCRHIRTLRRDTYTYVILLTAIERRAGYVEGLDAGADDFVTKPCGTDELQIRLRVAGRILALQNEAEVLEGLLPICPSCSRIKTESQNWQAVEGYVMRRTEAQFSHGVCPECYETHMKPQLEAVRRNAAGG
jgi:sigma-B regulation protein RsbU (phosphoserine phosphatase)